jgi:hypothetical protein
MKTQLMMLALIAITLGSCQWDSMKKENKTTATDSTEIVMDSTMVDSTATIATSDSASVK